MRDDFDTDEGLAARDREYERMAGAAANAGVPARRSGRAGAAAGTAAMDAARAKERAPLPGTGESFSVFSALLRPRSGRSEF